MVEEFAGKNHINYLAACGELGTAYNRVGNRKKALENQLLMREGLLKTAYDQGNTLSLADNNIGVTCIDDGRPEEAVTYLTEAYQLAEERTSARSPARNRPGIWPRLTGFWGMRRRKKSSSQKPSRASGTTTRRSIRRGWLQKNGSRN